MDYAFSQNGDYAKHSCSAFRDECYSTVTPVATEDPSPTSKCSYVVDYAKQLGATEFTVGNGNTPVAIDGDNAWQACENTLAISKFRHKGISVSDNFRLTGEWKKLHVGFTVLVFRNEVAKLGTNRSYSYGMTVRTNEFN